MVAGSAIQAFEEVCPERIDLIHKNYRKLCNLLIDVDEWGQVVIINMLTRYSRTQFLNPGPLADPENKTKNNSNIAEKQKEDENENKEDYSKDDFDNKFKIADDVNRSTVVIDPDHRLLLRVTKPLLQSRNSAVCFNLFKLF